MHNFLFATKADLRRYRSLSFHVKVKRVEALPAHVVTCEPVHSGFIQSSTSLERQMGIGVHMATITIAAVMGSMTLFCLHSPSIRWLDLTIPHPGH